MKDLKDEIFKINEGILVEIIDIFEESVLIQEVDSKEVYLVYYSEFDPSDAMLYNIEESNIISMEGWKAICQEKKKKKKRKNQPKRAQKPKKLQKNPQKRNLRIVLSKSL